MPGRKGPRDFDFAVRRTSIRLINKALQQDICNQNDRTLRSWSRPEIHYPAQHEDTTLRLQIDLRIVNQQTTIVSPSHVVITGIPIVDPKKGIATLIKSRESPCKVIRNESPCRVVRTLMPKSIGNTVGIMLLCFEILIMSECSSPGELCSSCMHGRKRDFKLAVRGPSTRHLPSTRSHSTTFGLSLVPKSTALHSTRTQTLPANVRCLQEPWRLLSGRRTM